MSIAEESLRMSGLFEAELLTELMMRHWNHPHANEPEYRTALLETASEILRLAISGTSAIDGVRSDKMNLVAALWCAEINFIDGFHEIDSANIEQRKAWTEAVRRAVPSCFCDPDFLV
ncbi:MAG TPA: hypothetical protein VGI75_03990 [Pirellulales bacterium]|jgi:hypothetical protein